MNELQNRVREWIIKTFGIRILYNKKERTMRLIEEAIELGQVAGLVPSEIDAITTRVYSRPVGEARQELGGAAICLMAAAESFGYDIEDVARLEVDRIENINPDYFRNRSAEKAAAGVGFKSEHDVQEN